MKKANVFLAIPLIALVLLAAACKSNPSSSPSSGSTPASQAPSGPVAPRESGLYPKLVNETVGKNAPADTLVGIGNAKLATLSQSRTLAASRARAELSRQLDVIGRGMVRDYQASSEIDTQAALAYAENFTLQLSRAEIVGSRIVAEDRDAEGQIWCVVYLDRINVVKEISQAAAAAKLAVPKAASIDAEARMNAAFEQVIAEEAAKYRE